MIVDEHVFTDAYLPDRLLHRDAAVNALADAFEPAVAGDRPADVVICGPSGVGKTVLARHTFDRLQRRAAVEWAHIRSLGKSPAGIARGVLEALGDDPATTTPEEELWRRLRQQVDRPLIVVLDEDDDLHTDALSKLTEIPLVAVVIVVHQPEALLERVDDDRIRQRLVGQELELSRYANTELADILEPRVRHGLTVNVERTYLESIADHIGGVAREGIQTLRATGSSPVQSVDMLTPADTGYADAIEHQTVGTTPTLTIGGTTGEPQTSLLLRGRTEHVAEEVRRIINDCIDVVRLAHQDGLLLPGGGAAAAALVDDILDYAASVPDRTQLAIEAFAEALEGVPRVLAQNAGQDPIDTITELQAREDINRTHTTEQ